MRVCTGGVADYMQTFSWKGISFRTFCTGRGLSEGYFENEAARRYEALEILSLTGHSTRVDSLTQRWTSLYRVR